MSHVSEVTVLRRVAALSLVLLTGSSLAACGGSDTGQTPRSTAAPAATSAQPTTAQGTDAKSTTPHGKLLSPSATKEGPDVVKAASKKTIAPKTVQSDVKKAVAALSKNGYPGAKISASGSQLTTVIVPGVSIAFFDSDHAAAEAAAQYVEIIKTRPGYSRIARTDSRVYIMSGAKSLLTKADQKKLAGIRKTVDAALSGV